jgi:hypothetical protein
MACALVRASKQPIPMSKYRNKPTNGYASKREAKRAQELKLLQTARKIFQLREQVKFTLIPKQEGERECAYIADFTYQEPTSFEPDGTIAETDMVVEDVKGMKTAVYKIKRKLMLHVHGVRIREV